MSLSEHLSKDPDPLPRRRKGYRAPPRDVDIHIGKMIRARRCMLGMSQSDLANRLGVSFQQVQKYESASNRISGSRLDDIARIFKVPASYFFAQGDQVSGGHVGLDLIDSPAAARLLRAFSGIRKSHTRVAIVALVESLCESAEQKG